MIKLPINLSPITRIAMGLVALAGSIILLTATLFAVMPERIEAARNLRAVASEGVAREGALLLQAGNLQNLDRLLQQSLERIPDLRSIRIVRADGRHITESGLHDSLWQHPDDGGAAMDNVVVPIRADELRWGEVQFAFASAYPKSLGGWLIYPPFAALMLISLLCLGAFYLYLRRVLEYLDPQAVIPERVRMAYDTFLEAVLLLDLQGRVVLANESLRQLHPETNADLNGKAAGDLAWLTRGMPKIGNEAPWFHAMHTKTPVTGKLMEIAQPGTPETTKVVLNCAPILDGHNNARGCMVVLSDVTALHRANRKLLSTLDELAASQQIIEEKNRELEKLATRDPMTGCLNRRALFDAIEPTFAKISAVGGDLCCIMGDIDHFKRFNDTYGHSVGDLVIKSVARCMGFGLRDGDLLCRYGGEEFCIFLPGVTVEQAWAIAERIRTQVQNEAGRSIRDQEGLAITSSFGVASIRQGAANVEALIDLADEALYHSKKCGRNQVTIWSEKMYETEYDVSCNS